ncbi:hypothetical protein ACFQ0P_07605 [Microbacterium insulae]|uniref:Mycothiol-dependent maleylpyruvate isomerase metal-binding domain-containing protein n=1 Tax=Microbacterium insulae TaxID=483014 RepID=A0ABW3AH61_9MICO
MSGTRGIVSRPDIALVLPALARETDALVDRALSGFLDYDFLEHSILGGRLSGGHVVTYLAREADRMADLLLAAIGRPLPAPDRDRRWELGEGGNLRPGAVLVADLDVSAERLTNAMALVEDWSAVPAELQVVPAHRLLQVIVHHADLGRSWQDLSQTDAVTVVSMLPSILAGELTGFELVIRNDDRALTSASIADGTTEITGEPRALIAWATGRRVPGDAAPPDPPSPPLRVWI